MPSHGHGVTTDDRVLECPCKYGDECAQHGGGQPPRAHAKRDRAPARRIHSPVHLELHQLLREYQGQVPAEQACSPCVRLSAEPDPQGSAERERFVHRGPGLLHRVLPHPRSSQPLSPAEDARQEPRRRCIVLLIGWGVLKTTTTTTTTNAGRFINREGHGPQGPGIQTNATVALFLGLLPKPPCLLVCTDLSFSAFHIAILCTKFPWERAHAVEFCMSTRNSPWSAHYFFFGVWRSSNPRSFSFGSKRSGVASPRLSRIASLSASYLRAITRRAGPSRPALRCSWT
mmetsp:Transcript_16277/g.61970  ORF Transcript_16277/g.61970 Transcript_16277/m.61970 type:complete len:287 (+) Transcript_16277:1024-1884(+)